jgi:hypothetical protein
MLPWTIAHLGSPLLLAEDWQLWVFLALPFILGSFGALIGQGSFLRIITAALGAASRDLVVAGLVYSGQISVLNPAYSLDASLILAGLTAAGAALMAALCPYRGKRLFFFSGLGGFAGQFILLAIIKHKKSAQKELA